MPLPKTVDVFGKRYTVKRDLDEHSDYGQCISEQCLIRVKPTQCGMQMRDTILHEITHAIEHEMKLDLKESQVHRLATGWLSVMRHNPKLVEFLMSDADS